MSACYPPLSGPQVVSRLEEHGMGPDGFIPQALSNMVWACAHLRNGTRGCSGPTLGGGPPTTVAKDSRPDWAPSPHFLRAVAREATTCMPNFQSQASVPGLGQVEGMLRGVLQCCCSVSWRANVVPGCPSAASPT